MKLSNYNQLVEHKDGLILYNQISGALMLLDQDDQEEFKNLDSASENLVQVLEEQGFLIDDNLDERAWMKDIYVERNHKNPLIKSVTVVVTDKCNLGCWYCYEDKAVWQNMSDETQYKTIRFVEHLLKSSKTKVLDVTWFGGEPIMNLKAVLKLSKAFDALAKEVGAKYTQRIITNGTMLNTHVIQQLVDVNCKMFQITIDGLKEEHDQNRPYLNTMRIEDMSDTQIKQRRQTDPSFGLQLPILDQKPIERSSFDDIMKNVKNLYEAGCNVSLRMNIQQTNRNSYEKLFNMIVESGFHKKNKKGGIVVPYPAWAKCDKKIEKSDWATMHFESSKEILRLNGMVDSSHTTSNLAFKPDSCMANRSFGFGISQTGKIAKCWHHISNEDHTIGTVDDLNLAENGWNDGTTPFDDPDCFNCSVLPSCMGGCKEYNEWWEKGTTGNKYGGCDEVRWTLPDRIRDLYEKSKGN